MVSTWPCFSKCPLHGSIVVLAACCPVTTSMSVTFTCLQVQSRDRGLLSAARHRHPSTGGPNGDRGAGQSHTRVCFSDILSFLWRSRLQGIILSGGQKQRISVARALYQQTNVVFLVTRSFLTSAGLLWSREMIFLRIHSLKLAYLMGFVSFFLLR